MEVKSHTEPEQARQEEADEEEGEADVELGGLADAGFEWLACRSLPDVVER